MRSILFATLLLLPMLLSLIMQSCNTPPPGADSLPTRTPEQWKADVVSIATLVGDIVVQTRGTAWVLREAPDLMPVLDVDRDGVITLAEVGGAPPDIFSRDAVARLLVLATAEYLRRN